MDSRRTVLIILFLVMSFFMYQQWLLKTTTNTPGVQAPTAETISGGNQTLGDGSLSSTAGSSTTASGDVLQQATLGGSETIVAGTNNSETIRVTTDLFDISIALEGGDIVRSELREHAETLGESARYSILFQRQSGELHIAESGLNAEAGFYGSVKRPTYTAAANSYELSGETLTVPLTYIADNGSRITKEFVFTRGDYAVNVHHKVENNTNTDIQMQLYGRLIQSMVDNGRSMFMPTYRGAAYSSESERYKKYSFKDIQKRALNQNTEAGWVAMLEHYFVTAWVPDQTARNTLKSQIVSGNNARISFEGPIVTVAAGSSYDFESNIYMGPKNQERLAKLAKHLDLTVDYGFLWWLAQPIHWLIAFLFGFVKNYGVAIILITIIIKGLLYPLTKAQHTSMAKMRKVAPRMAELKERFGDDKQKMSQAMMKMYKEEKVNPLGGCLPMFLQLPIFLSLYWVLLESPEIRHADFMLWITDLSSRDPYFILPVLMGASMFFMQRLQPTPMTDPMQQKIMQMMPVVFTVFFLFFPAGLVLYWLVSNLITILQMLWIYRQFDKENTAK
ncbi:membrane protein insertase YidC [Aliidiomarina quisquiliarum]|uniref:membrane protein insertase YidC n=1 Tax=Aliidiomarina quisquiliarum TaxID=2938947 RepID=UPI00208E70E6|nr:membrane protein insertase YidC [Aliidiomarina quisquiliarum]MCO4321279.1 membrane protein insertase YidC [Aliidiomarina quisquiliarum]